MTGLENVGAVCFDCAKREGFVLKEKAMGVWEGECEICHQRRPCTHLWNDWNPPRQKREGEMTRKMRPKMPKTAKKAGKEKAPRVRMDACKKEPRNWIVRVAYYYPDGSYESTLEMEVIGPFKDRYVAIEMLNRTIREIWTAEVDTADDVKDLADCRGQCELGEGDEKWSSWNYSEDGETAWCFFGDGHGYKGEVVEISALPAEGET